MKLRTQQRRFGGGCEDEDKDVLAAVTVQRGHPQELGRRVVLAPEQSSRCLRAPRSVQLPIVSHQSYPFLLLAAIAFVAVSVFDKIVSVSGLLLLGLRIHPATTPAHRSGRRNFSCAMPSQEGSVGRCFQGPATSTTATAPFHNDATERRRRNRSSSALGTATSSEAGASESLTPSPIPPTSFRSGFKRVVTSLWRRIVHKTKEEADGNDRANTETAFGNYDDPGSDDDGDDEQGASPSFRRHDGGRVDDDEDDDVLHPIRIGDGGPSVLSSLSNSATSLLPLPSLLVPPAPGSSPSPPSPLLPSPPSTSASSSPLGGVVGVMGQLEAFRGAQRTGAQTSQLLLELQNSVQVDASSYGNHVKVIMDGRQRIKSVEFDEQFLKTAEPYEVSAAVVEALQLAHDKSVDKMDEKVKAFYSKLGLFGSGGGSSGGGWIS